MNIDVSDPKWFWNKEPRGLLAKAVTVLLLVLFALASFLTGIKIKHAVESAALGAVGK